MSDTRLSKLLALSPLHQGALAFPQQAAIKLAGQDICYSELSQRVIALGQQLRAAGIAEDEPLACVAVNNLEMICLYWACIDIGAIFFPISPRFPLAQIQGLIDEHQIRYVWRAEISDLQNCSQLALDFNRLSNELAQPVDITRPANVILTSGSSGFPKAAVHCLANHIANAEGALSLIPLEQGDAWLLSLPLFHIGGLAILNRCALVGATVVMPDQALSLSQQINQDKLTHLSLVPAQLSKLLADTSSKLITIKALLLGGGAVSLDLLAELKLRNIASYTSYGMTEMSSQITTGRALSDGSSGKLLPKRELKIEDRVIWVRGECLFMGYLTDKGIEKPLDADGWFYTKDRGEWDENGNLHILGRVDNMFICGGENIQPEEIEAALKQHPQIDDAIVFAIPDAQFGNLPAAILRGSLTHLTESIANELELFLADKIARFKRPRQYYVWPENHEQTGLKVNRKALIANLVKH
ncbi:o-succinylbenzoate--CoA ligase [Shewanella baltica]|uniref:o-succinylbenzoate--CoA ligase n=1 Tax=Shewanella baltica TaxID=62322 RepID=UPI00217D0268|nr:o-succinylbenzoate--CoA ligase [Shewanella baltica]MCS6128324.1 o-succinylbenzoate--CoA ligase [Shewanella baltica]MCS6140241.1 o-succinylbenzoate--CoA ligase [Shewanella baltica]MCS6146538.1 o-succinylbenzoate--CoA ligase [Shewanella baltica]MCS6171068.1 o-succinylbenzoate--CoA ligase [Shewanella baltica]MCS6188278.1 o-succinylbenzoate--CoA ligase [Shewanella baltica]